MTRAKAEPSLLSTVTESCDSQLGNHVATVKRNGHRHLCLWYWHTSHSLSGPSPVIMKRCCRTLSSGQVLKCFCVLPWDHSPDQNVPCLVFCRHIWLGLMEAQLARLLTLSNASSYLIRWNQTKWIREPFCLFNCTPIDIMSSKQQ